MYKIQKLRPKEHEETPVRRIEIEEKEEKEEKRTKDQSSFSQQGPVLPYVVNI